MTIVTKKRFKDNGETILSFGEEFLVICLKCQNCANVIPKFQEIKYNKYSYSKIDSVKLTCLSCGYAKLKEEFDTFYLGNYDFYFQLPL